MRIISGTDAATNECTLEATSEDRSQCRTTSAANQSTFAGADATLALIPVPSAIIPVVVPISLHTTV